MKSIFFTTIVIIAFGCKSSEVDQIVKGDRYVRHMNLEELKDLCDNKFNLNKWYDSLTNLHLNIKAIWIPDSLITANFTKLNEFGIKGGETDDYGPYWIMSEKEFVEYCKKANLNVGSFITKTHQSDSDELLSECGGDSSSYQKAIKNREYIYFYLDDNLYTFTSLKPLFRRTFPMKVVINKLPDSLGTIDVNLFPGLFKHYTSKIYGDVWIINENDFLKYGNATEIRAKEVIERAHQRYFDNVLRKDYLEKDSVLERYMQYREFLYLYSKKDSSAYLPYLRWVMDGYAREIRNYEINKTLTSSFEKLVEETPSNFQLPSTLEGAFQMIFSDIKKDLDDTLYKKIKHTRLEFSTKKDYPFWAYAVKNENTIYVSPNLIRALFLKTVVDFYEMAFPHEPNIFTNERYSYIWKYSGDRGFLETSVFFLLQHELAHIYLGVGEGVAAERLCDCYAIHSYSNPQAIKRRIGYHSSAPNLGPIYYSLFKEAITSEHYKIWGKQDTIGLKDLLGRFRVVDSLLNKNRINPSSITKRFCDTALLIKNGM